MAITTDFAIMLINLYFNHTRFYDTLHEVHLQIYKDASTIQVYANMHCDLVVAAAPDKSFVTATCTY